MEVQETHSGLRSDRIKFHIQKKYDGFVVFQEQFDGTRLTSSKELGIIYARKQDAVRGMDSLVRLSKGTNPGKSVEWKD